MSTIRFYCVIWNLVFVECITIIQWFLNWVRSNPRGSMSRLQGFGGHQEIEGTYN